MTRGKRFNLGYTYRPDKPSKSAFGRTVVVFIALAILFVVVGVNAEYTVQPSLYSPREVLIASCYMIIAVLVFVIVLCWAIRGSR